jgi:hypothetical protein
LGISLETTFTSRNGRPMKIANSGKVIKQLMARNSSLRFRLCWNPLGPMPASSHHRLENPVGEGIGSRQCYLLIRNHGHATIPMGLGSANKPIQLN